MCYQCLGSSWLPRVRVALSACAVMGQYACDMQVVVATARTWRLEHFLLDMHMLVMLCACGTSLVAWWVLAAVCACR